MPHVAIVAAVKRELRPLLRSWNRVEIKYGTHRYTAYESPKLEAVAIFGGMNRGGADCERGSAHARKAGVVDFGGVCRSVETGVEGRRCVRAQVHRGFGYGVEIQCRRRGRDFADLA